MNSLGATRITTLKIQYRMHPDICELISRKFYDDQLECLPGWTCKECLKQRSPHIITCK